MKKKLESKIREWLEPPFDKSTHLAISKLRENSEVLEDAFYKDLEFGTGGMRGIMGVGTNRINQYTLGKSTQGLSDYLKKKFKGEIKTVIAYDCRKNSKSLARKVADVFSANGIKVFLYSDLRSTPQLSFTVRHLKANCGIVLTASHNPPEYNGYKVYWEDGGQIVPPQDQEIIRQIEKTKFDKILSKPNDSLIEIIGDELDKAFIDASLKLGLLEIDLRSNFKIVFTSLHGTSITAVPQVLKNAGYNNVNIVAAQAKPDGNFPTVKSPNPEDPEALKLAIEEAEKLNADIVIGTDPDSDRLGVAVRDLDNKFYLLNGNQTMVVMTYYLLENWKKKNNLNGKQFIASTIVSSPMIKKIALSYGVKYMETLTGFKWIGKMINDFSQNHFIAGGEESYGFLFGDFVRDKDAIASSLLICEIFNELKEKNKSFLSILTDCYIKYGFYSEKLVTKKLDGLNGRKKIELIIDNFRKNPPKKIGNSDVLFKEDYLSGEKLNLKTKKTEKIKLPKSNLIILKCEDETSLCIRPSGTEPKIKYYFSVNSSLKSSDHYIKIKSDLDSKLNQLIKELV